MSSETTIPNSSPASSLPRPLPSERFEQQRGERRTGFRGRGNEGVVGRGGGERGGGRGERGGGRGERGGGRGERGGGRGSLVRGSERGGVVRGGNERGGRGMVVARRGNERGRGVPRGGNERGRGRGRGREKGRGNAPQGRGGIGREGVVADEVSGDDPLSIHQSQQLKQQSFQQIHGGVDGECVISLPPIDRSKKEIFLSSLSSTNQGTSQHLGELQERSVPLPAPSREVSNSKEFLKSGLSSTSSQIETESSGVSETHSPSAPDVNIIEFDTFGISITRNDLYDFWATEGSKTVWTWMWVFANLFFFLYGGYQNLPPVVPNYVWTLAKASAATLNLNLALLLLPVMKGLITLLRTFYFVRRYVPVDHWFYFHRLISIAIAIHGTIHTICHYIDISTVESSWKTGWADRYGFTGHIITLSMIFMFSAAVAPIRSSSFNIFFFTHKLYIPVYLCMLIHSRHFYLFVAVPGVLFVVEKIVSYLRRRPAVSVLDVAELPSDVIALKMSRPDYFEYKSGQYLFLNCPSISKYEWHPFTITSSPHDSFLMCHIYCGGDWAQALRYVLRGLVKRREKKIERMRDCQWGGDSVEMDGNGNRQTYTYCNSSSSSSSSGGYQFTIDTENGEGEESGESGGELRLDVIIQEKENETVVVKEKRTKDEMKEWEEDVRKLVLMEEEKALVYGHLLHCDGPYGAASETVFDFEILMMIGAGIGITPFASILRTLNHRIKIGAFSVSKIKKIHFYWIMRNNRAFEWFQYLLEDVVKELESRGMADLLSIKIHITGDDLSSFSNCSLPMVQVNFGRPDFDEQFRKIRATFNKKEIGVFFCGPKLLGKTLEDYCFRYSSDYITYGTKFLWHQETF